MCELYAMSSSKPASIHISLSEFQRHGGDTDEHADGWGLAFVEKGNVEIHREPMSAAYSDTLGEIIEQRQPASLVMSHIRKATQGEISLNNTQPFRMEIEGKTHLLIHNGHLDKISERLDLRWYKPKGETDSEIAFGYLMELIKPLWLKASESNNTPSFQERFDCVELAFNRLDLLGIANLIYYDGEYLYAFGNERKQFDGSVAPPGIWYLSRHWSSIDHAHISGMSMSGQSQEQLLFASVPLTTEYWIPLARNQLVVAKEGRLVHS